MLIRRLPIIPTRAIPRISYSQFHTTVVNLNKGTTGCDHKGHDFAFVFDIDGFLSGKKPILQAKPALEILNSHKIPYILMTNGGGVLERRKAEEVSEITQLNPPISPLQIVQSHTP